MFAFFLTTAFGFFAMQKSWNGVVFLYLDSDERIPAAIKRTHDLSNLRGVALLNASRERLITSSKVLHYSPAKIAIVLGHFITSDPKSLRRVSACDIYEKVEVTLKATGIATAGAAPTMVIEGPCKISKDDLNVLEPLWINAQEIVKQVPGDHEFIFTVKNTAHIKFIDIIDEWPSEWEIQTVKMFGSIKGQQDVIDVSINSLPKNEQSSRDRVLNLR